METILLYIVCNHRTIRTKVKGKGMFNTKSLEQKTPCGFFGKRWTGKFNITGVSLFGQQKLLELMTTESEPEQIVRSRCQWEAAQQLVYFRIPIKVLVTGR